MDIILATYENGVLVRSVKLSGDTYGFVKLLSAGVEVDKSIDIMQDMNLLSAIKTD